MSRRIPGRTLGRILGGALGRTLAVARFAWSAAIALLLAPALARAQEPAPPTLVGPAPAPPTLVGPPPAPPPTPPPTPTTAPDPPGRVPDALLEQRATEDLAARGTPLSRLGVALRVATTEQRGAVTLVDLATRRVLASAAIDELPADREAAVASVTQIAASLAAQLATSAAQAARRERAAAASASAGPRPGAYPGNSFSILDGAGFYEAIERPDLAKRYRRRRTIGLAVSIGGISAASLGGTYFLSFYLQSDHGKHPVGTLWPALSMAAIAIGIPASLIGGYFVEHPHPISGAETQRVIEQYNAQRRRKHAVSTRATPRPRGRELDISPYFVGDAGGLALAGRF